METIITYKCLNCDAGLLFDPDKQLFKCEFCLSEFAEADLKNTENDKKAQEKTRQNEEFRDAVLEYYCSNCGAEVIAEKNTAADFCYYCHNPIVLTDKFSGNLRPTKIIPFKFNKDEAKERFIRFAKKKWFLPRDYLASGSVEKIAGVYYPFWVTDADTKCFMNASATRVRSWRAGDYRYTETSWYDVERTGDIHFEDIVTSALKEADKAMLEGILPYPSDSLQEFSMPYLSGYVAKKRDIERAELTDEVRGKMNEYSETLLKRTVSGYATVNVTSKNVNVLSSHWEYSLMPIWILTYKSKKGKTYTYAMNGYTGKIYGEYPFDLKKVLAFAAGLALVVGAVAALFGGAFIC